MEIVYLTNWYWTFCLTFFLTDIHFWGKLEHVGDGVQKSSVDQPELQK